MNRPIFAFGMAASFREVAAYSGFDENLPTGGQGIVVPSGASTLVILEEGRDLGVRSTMPKWPTLTNWIGGGNGHFGRAVR
jgi:hypothetical protein